MRLVKLIFTIMFLLLLNGCGSDTSKSSSSAVLSKVLDSTDERCPNGGIEIFTGIDENQNGKLDTDEYDNFEVVCNGTNGVDGQNGTDGINGTNGVDGQSAYTTLMANSSLPVGDVSCPNGGVQIQFGLDTDRSGVLDTSEVTSTTVVCHGMNGADGVDGVSAQMTVPIIHSLHASPAIVKPSEKINFGAVVTDPDGGSMTFSWVDANGVEFSTDKMVTKEAPSEEGVYLYSFSATDDQNQTVTGYVNVQVMNCDIWGCNVDLNPTTEVILDCNTSVSLPGDVALGDLTGDVVGKLLTAGGDQNVSGAVYLKPALNGEQTAQIYLNNVINNLASNMNSGAGATFSNISTRNHQTNSVISSGVTAYYDMTLSSAFKAVDVMNDMVQLTASKIVGGNVNTSMVASSSALAATTYRFAITVQYLDQNCVLTRFAMVAYDDANTYETELDVIVNPSSIKVPGMICETDIEEFAAHATTTQLADFLFVIDNSGSMSEEQTAISQVATEFGNRLTATNLDYHIGIISTDSTTLRGGGFFDNDIVGFQNNVVLGTWGSAYERGIYQAEQALLSSGTVATAGYPRLGATLSVIVLSDEKSQYPGSFDPLKNLFVDNGYTFYSIIDTNDPGQYIELSDATNGTYASIHDTTAYTGIVTKIAADAGAISSGYKLPDDHFVDAASIGVSVDDTVVTKDTTNGWTYHEATNSIVFHGSATPSVGSVIKVAYNYCRLAEIKSLTISVNASAFNVGDIIDMHVTATFEDNSTKAIPLSDLNITSSNTAVASITNHVITAQGVGTTDITVSTASNVTATTSVLVQ